MSLRESRDLALYVMGSYRDFLKEEIGINRIMLYREECLPSGEISCLHMKTF